jgi:hypothetical protein
VIIRVDTEADELKATLRIDDLRALQRDGHRLTAKEQAELDTLVSRKRAAVMAGSRDGRLFALSADEQMALNDLKRAEGQGAIGG